MKPLFHQVTIVGLGFIGGSVGMEARHRRLARAVVGLSRSGATIRRARSRGAIDWGTTNPARAVRDADLVVLATPVDTIAPRARSLAPFMRPGGLLTDAGSTKAAVVETLDRRLPRRVAFVGAHPVAGSEQRGLEAAQAGLFEGSLCIVTPTTRTDRRALAAVSRFWAGLGMQVVRMSPARHDRLLAGGSHLPHLIAYALAGSLSPGLPRAPRSFLDMTRIARSEPDLWDDIFLSSRQPLLEALVAFTRELERLGRAVAKGDRTSLRRRLARAKARRDALEAR
jgi:prephenate dehydrogenase